MKPKNSIKVLDGEQAARAFEGEHQQQSVNQEDIAQAPGTQEKAMPAKGPVVRQEEAVKQEIPAELVSKISAINSSRGRIEYSDFKDTLIPITGIPSHNVCYHDVASGMPLKVHDLMMLEGMMSDPNITDAVITSILRKYTNINPSDILEGDEPYILMWLRENTFPESPLIHSFTCKKCGKRHVNKTVGIDDAVFKRLPEWYHRGYIASVSGMNFRVRPRTRGGIIEKNRYIGSTSKKLDAGDMHVLDMALCIDEPLNKAIAMIENVSVEGLPDLYQVVSIMKNFGFTGKFDVKCEGCGSSNLALFRFRKRFYIPEPQGYRIDGDAI